MPWLVIAFLLVLWIVGLLTSTSLGGGIHVLLVFAILILLRRVVQGPAVALQKRGDGIHHSRRKP